VAIVQPSGTAAANARRISPAYPGFRGHVCRDCAVDRAIQRVPANAPAPVPLNIAALPEWACHDVMACTKCRVAFFVQTHTPQGAIATTFAGRLFKHYEDIAKMIVESESLEWTNLMRSMIIGHPIADRELMARAEHVVSTRVQRTTDPNIFPEALCALARTTRGYTHAQLSQAVIHAMQSVSRNFSIGLAEAPYMLANLDLRRMLSQYNQPTITHRVLRFAACYNHPFGGPGARNLTPSFQRVKWACEESRD
jgi:hypothetical protein